MAADGTQSKPVPTSSQLRRSDPLKEAINESPGEYPDEHSDWRITDIESVILNSIYSEFGSNGPGPSCL